MACGDASSQFAVMRGSMGYRSTNWDAWDIGVAIIDSGVASSSDLRITAAYDFRTGLALPATPADGYGHGTHIAGLIAASGARSNGNYAGVATGARIIGLKVLDGNGGGYTSDVIEAVEFATANKAALGIDVINLSLGHPIYEPAANDPLVPGRRAAVRAGIVVVVSAGNNGMNRERPDRLRRHHVAGQRAVGDHRRLAATQGHGDARDDDVVAPFSSRGPTWFDGFAKPDILAPGQALVAPVRRPRSSVRRSPRRG